MSESRVDPVLGLLEWDGQLDWWIGKVEIAPGHSVEIFISPEDDSPDVILPRVRDALERIRRDDHEYRRWTAEQVADDRWNSDEPMTVPEIAALLRLASINFCEDGSAGLYWDDQDRLYAGHNLITELDADGRCTAVRMEG
jgi:hypothetical protein